MFSFGSAAQENLAAYKYILVPKQYEFQKGPDSYQINSLHKFLFEKAGFETLFTDELYPEDLVKERCLALTSKIVSNPSMFKTRFTVELYDCYNKLVYAGPAGTSKIKDYTKAYNQTLRRAMAELIEAGHVYDPTGSIKNELSAKAAVKDTLMAVTEVAASKIQPAIKVDQQTKEEIKPAAQKTTIKEAATDELKPVKEEVAIAAIAESEEKADKVELQQVAQESAPSIEGTYVIDLWGRCNIVKKGNGYAVVGGDEDFEFATISTTSNPSIFMMKKTGFKQVQLLELTAEGNIKIDTADGFKTYKKHK